MTSEPPRPPPQSTVQVTGQVASDVVAGLKSQPMLLAIVVLNIVAIGAVVWFLRSLAANTHERTQYLLEHCIDGKLAPPAQR